ncbi:MAG: indolepyruvate oxidoreductase subunit beta, partial [Oscillospiraceae bacterium]|nr:indolepyruvate oxidoreductase subunit beta [Oscillospiraceae bacterium]
YSPIIDEGEADFILGFERLEAARWLKYLKKGGRMIVNTQRIDPMPVITGAAEYPQEIIGNIEASGVLITAFDALSPAVEAGSPKAVNVVLIGVLAKMMKFEKSVWDEALKNTVPKKLLNLNKAAFEFGYNYK